ncbi:F-box family protein [Rhynchospora pubera]|uniref:F-box family protein n=1 Tax=Rhynchospora pubera TaxID=906938 RepID=A0AAV8GPZ1_9POAL|nr:F-box family protein [Rhynchospora pubera]
MRKKKPLIRLDGPSFLGSWRFPISFFSVKFSLRVALIGRFSSLSKTRLVQSTSLERDWSSLPPEVLNLFAKKLNEISDFLRFRAVCTAWCSSTKITDLPLQFPWILENRRYPHESDLCFYSVPFGKMYTINAPKFSGKENSRLSNGYMLVHIHTDTDSLGKCTFHKALLNPLNNHEIRLPGYGFGLSATFIGPWQNERGVHMVCTEHIDDQQPKLLSYHLGQDNWCELSLAPDAMKCNMFYLNGMLFMVERESGGTKVMDITTNTLAYVIPPIECYLPMGKTFIIDACGHILRVFRHHHPSEDLYRYWFDVHRHHHLVGSSDSAGIKGNCIYSLMRIFLGMQEGFLHSIERIDIETGAREHVPCPLEEPDSWFVPNLQRL